MPAARNVLSQLSTLERSFDKIDTYRNPDDGLFSVSCLIVVELDVSFRDRERSVLLGYQSLRNGETCCTVVSKEISLHRIELRRARRGFRVTLSAFHRRAGIFMGDFNWLQKDESLGILYVEFTV